MKTIGLVGGITWVSTIEYYRFLNQGIQAALGHHNFCKCLIYSVNFQEIQDNKARDDWEATFELLLDAAETLVKAGAEAILIGANTMHFAADRLQAALSVPLIHIASVTADAIVKSNLQKVALLGTRYTMEMDFYKDKLGLRGIATIIPDEEDRAFIHQTIYEELCYGILKPETKLHYQSIIEKLANAGAQGVILGCTEIPMVIQEGDVSIPVFDTTKIHAAAAVSFALG
jgi:aspartate racemase